MKDSKFILLTENERERFATYCEQNSETAEEMAKQLKKMPGSVMDTMIAKEKRNAAAFFIVADYIRKFDPN